MDGFDSAHSIGFAQVQQNTWCSTSAPKVAAYYSVVRQRYVSTYSLSDSAEGAIYYSVVRQRYVLECRLFHKRRRCGIFAYLPLNEIMSPFQGLHEEGGLRYGGLRRPPILFRPFRTFSESQLENQYWGIYLLPKFVFILGNWKKTTKNSYISYISQENKD